MNKYQHSRGFTLIELAIVLVIVAVLLGAFLSTLSSRIETTRRAETRKELAIIKQALYGYAMSQTPAHLPCPDCRAASATSSCPSAGNTLNDGIADRNATTGLCDTNNDVGNLPWVTLGLAASDAWGNRYSYWVSSSVVNSSTKLDLTATPTNEATVDTRINGNLTVVSSSAVAVIVSQGKNGYGATPASNITNPPVPVANVDEADNLDNNLRFVTRAPTQPAATTAGGEFDDMLTWISEYEYKAKLVEAGALP